MVHMGGLWDTECQCFGILLAGTCDMYGKIIAAYRICLGYIGMKYMRYIWATNGNVLRFSCDVCGIHMCYV